MNPSPASVAALLLVAAAVTLIILSATAVSPQTVRVPDIRLSPEQKGTRAPQHKQRQAERRVAERRSTPEPDSPTAAAAPVATPAQTPVATHEEAATIPDAPEPASVVTAYYRALDSRRFEGAWNTLTPAVRTTFGGFEHWRTGYATTVASHPHGIAVQRDGIVASIAHELVTEDRSPCGPVQQRFDVRWRLVLGSGGWRAASLTAVKRSGHEPDAACTARHDAGRGAGGR